MDTLTVVNVVCVASQAIAESAGEEMALVARFDDGFRHRKESRANWQSALLRKFVSNFYATMMPFINPSEHLVDIRNAERKTALFRHVVEAYKVMPIWLFSETPFRHSTFNQKSL